MRFTLDLPFSDYSLKVGYTNDSELEQQRNSFLEIMSSQTNLILLMQDYSKSYASVSSPTLYSYKDLLVSELIGLSLINGMYKADGSLSPHAQKLYDNYPKSEIYPDLEDPATSKRYGGLYGTLAYWLPAQEGSILDLYKQALENYWNYLLIDKSLSPANKVNSYINFVFQDAPLESWVSKLDSSDVLYKRNLLSNQDFENLRAKFIWSSYNPLAINYLASKLDPTEQVELKSLITRSLRMALPGGIRQFLIAIAAQSFTNSIETVLSYQDQPLSSLPPDLAQDLAENYATAYDCLNVLSIENNYNSDVYYFLSRSSISSIPKDSPLFVSSAI